MGEALAARVLAELDGVELHDHLDVANGRHRVRHAAVPAREGREGYEMYVMSWCGPQQEEFLGRLIRRTVEELTPLGIWAELR